MTQRAFVALVLAAISILSSGCGSDRVAGGNSTEADNALTVALSDSLGRPVVGARVILMPESSVDSTQARTGTTDARGTFEATSLPPGRWRATFLRDGRTGLWDGPTGDRNGRAVLAAAASCSGQVRGARTGVRVGVRGFPVLSALGPDGRFRLEGLPAGSHTVVALDGLGDTATLPPVSLAPGQRAIAPSPLQLDPSWAAESLQVAALLARLGQDPSRTRRHVRFGSGGEPVGILLDSVGLDSLPASWPYPTWMRDLSARGNRLRALPAGLSATTTLLNLDLAGNPLVLPDSLRGFEFLRSLDLSHCGLRSLPILEGFRNLVWLALDGDSLGSIPEATWRLPSLEVISLKDAGLASLPPFPAGSPLRQLRMGGNRLRALPDGWQNLSQLRELWLYNNPLDSLPSGLGSLANLTTLSLENAGLSSLPSSLASLPQTGLLLKISGNRLCQDQGAPLEAWLDGVLGAPWRAKAQQTCP